VNARNSLPVWPEQSLAECCDIVMGQSPPSSTYNTDGLGLPFLQGKAEFTELSPSPLKHCSAPSRIAEAGSVLVSVRAPVGDANLADRTYAIGRGLAALSPRSGDARYWFYRMLYERRRLASLGSGTTFQAINKGTLQGYTVPVPSLAEQRGIARALRAVQEAKEARLRELELGRERKAALVEHLFTYGTRGESTKQTELGETPVTWDVAAFGSLCLDLRYGTSQKCATDAVGIPVLRIPNVAAGEISTRDLKYADLDTATASPLLLDEGDLLFVRTNGRREYAGRCAMYCGKPAPAAFASYLIRARVDDERAFPRFVELYAGTRAGVARLSGRAVSTADGKFNINSQTLRRMSLPLPSLPEQKRVAAAADACDSTIQALEREATLHAELFASALEEVMSGRLSVRALIRE
jgi:type I restriction enzyme, S subunit